jgi:hypothetical protein
LRWREWCLFALSSPVCTADQRDPIHTAGS